MRSAALTALAGLHGISPTRLRILLAHHDPVDAFERLRARRSLHPMVTRGLAVGRMDSWRDQAARTSLDALATANDGAGIDVVAADDPRFPVMLQHDPDPPAVLFVRGDLAVLERRRVGIVGTRHASAGGRATASDLGAALAAAGVAVVSGLARGIDASAHRGVRSVDAGAIAVGVVGSGLDVPYPKVNADLWEWVGSNGLLVSEWPLRTQPDAWRFPQRNRILAACSEVVVVVESRERGGSLITARAAADRDIEVMAVPGSPRSRASAGTNQLLTEGVAPVTAVDDVLVMLGLDHRRDGPLPFDPRPLPDAVQQVVLDACGHGPSNLDMLVTDTGLSITEVALAAARLERMGWLVEAGGWFEPAGSRLRS